MNKENVYRQLFDVNKAKAEAPQVDEVLDLLTAMASANVTENMILKTHILRLICAVAVRLSLIASVWVFIFNPNLWYGILLFLVLTLLFGGVEDRSIPMAKKE